MPEPSSSPPPADDAARAVAVAIVRRLRANGFEAFLVGGCVRDLLIDRSVKDWDVATSATPDDVQRLFSKVIPVGAQFGVCRVRSAGVEVEVATFRADEGYEDGRRPSGVRFTSAREDVLRRDFTINGLLQDPETGVIVDYVGGREDLARGVVRAIGDPEERFAEDRLRMLRAVRFTARFGFVLDPATAEAVRRHADRIHVVSAERVRDEVLRILTEGGAAIGFDHLIAVGLLAPVLPEVASLRRDERARTRAVLAALDGLPRDDRDERLALAALLHVVPLEAARAVVGRLSLPRRVTADVLATVRDLADCDGAPTWPLHRLKRTLRASHADTLLALHGLESSAGRTGAAAGARFLRERRAAWSPEDLHPTPLLRGGDFEAMGYPRGPLFRELQTALEEAQLDEQVATPDEARAFLRGRFRASG